MTAIIPISTIDSSKYSIEQIEVAGSEDEENLEVPDDDDSIIQMTHGTKYKITNIKKGKALQEGTKAKVLITEIVVNQGNMVLYAKNADAEYCNTVEN